MMTMTDEQIDKIKRKRARDTRILRDKAAVQIAKFSLPTIILLFGGLVGSILYIEDASMIAVIASSVSSVSMALIGILNNMTGVKDKEDPIVSIIKMQSDLNKSLIDHLKSDKNKSTELSLDNNAIKIVDGHVKANVGKDLLYGDDKNKKK